VANYFWYDAMMRRYAMQDSSGLSYFTWDSNGMNLLAERDSAGSVTAYYTHGFAAVDGIGSAVAVKQNRFSASYYQYPVYDHRGTVVRLLDANGTPTAYYEYDAWGNQLRNDVVAGISDNRFRYQSNWIELGDSDGKICLSPTRLYHAGTGRFLERDMLRMSSRPISPLWQGYSRYKSVGPLERSRGGIEARYALTLNTPTLLLDPSGLATKEQCEKVLTEIKKMNSKAVSKKKKLNDKEKIRILWDEIKYYAKKVKENAEKRKGKKVAKPAPAYSKCIEPRVTCFCLTSKHMLEMWKKFPHKRPQDVGRATTDLSAVMIFYENIPGGGDLISKVLLHEMIHAYDTCVGTATRGAWTCEERACTEIRAFKLSGACEKGGVLNKDKKLDPAACVRKHAIASVEGGDPLCKPGKDHVDSTKLWNRCFKDESPFAPVG